MKHNLFTFIIWERQEDSDDDVLTFRAMERLPNQAVATNSREAALGSLPGCEEARSPLPREQQPSCLQRSHFKGGCGKYTRRCLQALQVAR